MNFRSRRMILGALITTAVVFSLSSVWAAGQGGSGPRRQMAEEVFKNIQVFKGVPADEFIVSMGFISNALAVNCTYCHSEAGGGGWDRYALDTDAAKRTSRRMVLMMNEINKTNFGGRQVVTCVSCHNGATRPKAVFNLAPYYSIATGDEPNDILRQAPGAPSADQVIDKYIQALGGTQRLAGLTSFSAKGTYLGYGEPEKNPLEVLAKAPGQRTVSIRTISGDMTTTYDGGSGWVRVPEPFSPLQLRVLAGTELEAAKLDVDLAFPAQLKQALSGWRGAVPTALGDRDVQVIQGQTATGSPVKLYFDEESGLLVRVVRHLKTPLGRSPRLMDLSDYREVAGIKMPFRLDIYQESGMGTIELTDVQPNVPVNAARFARPAPPARSETP